MLLTSSYVLWREGRLCKTVVIAIWQTTTPNAYIMLLVLEIHLANIGFASMDTAIFSIKYWNLRGVLGGMARSRVVPRAGRL